MMADWLQLAPALTPRAACSQPAIGEVSDTLFKWPIITQEDEDAVIDVLRNESLSGTNITREFEVGSQMHQRPLLPAIARLTPRLLCLYGQVEFAEWIGLDHALAYPNGTMAILGTPSSRPHPHPHPGCPHPTRLSACWTYLPTYRVGPTRDRTSRLSPGCVCGAAAIYAAGVRRGDEIICPSMTFWASCAQALQLGEAQPAPGALPAKPMAHDAQRVASCS